MGCGESKQNVATGNTILSRKKSNPDPKKSKDIETILETNTKDNIITNSSVQQQQAENEGNKDFGGAVAAGAKDVKENTTVKEGEDDKQIDKGKEDGDVEEKEAAGRLISLDSPNHYFSPRKNEEGIFDGIISEGRSEESDYYSPSHAAGKEDLLSENVKADNGVEGKELVEQTKAEKENIL